MNIPGSLLLLLAFASVDAAACSCAVQSTDDFVANADSIHFATLRQAKLVQGEYRPKWPSIEGVFEVRETLKGKARAKTLTITTGTGGGDCGVPMEVAQSYILYLDETQTGIGICGGSGTFYGFQEEEIRAKVKAAMAQRSASPRRK